MRCNDAMSSNVLFACNNHNQQQLFLALARLSVSVVLLIRRCRPIPSYAQFTPPDARVVHGLG